MSRVRILQPAPSSLSLHCLTSKTDLLSPESRGRQMTEHRQKKAIGSVVLVIFLSLAALAALGTYLVIGTAPPASPPAPTLEVTAGPKVVCGSSNPAPDFIQYRAQGSASAWEGAQSVKVPTSRITGCRVTIYVEQDTLGKYDRQCRDAYGTWNDAPPELRGNCREFRLRCKSSEPCVLPYYFGESRN